ncbi:MAG TPA: polyphosphate kinase 2 family protein [Actinomycetota bacterium]|nr:polyphosphate kinase 2 family protein [Actinomycetota bacterium]
MDRWKIPPNSTVSLHDIPTDSTDGAPGDKKHTGEALRELNKKLSGYQERLWAEGSQSLLVVLQAMDTAGKDSTIRKVFTGVNPQGVHVVSFKSPNSTELEHDFLWRIHQAVPAKGEIGVFNRSHYEDVLIVRVKNLLPEKLWRERYELINNFERQLGHAGTTVIKFFLHISKQEQANRLRARLEDPTKRWKFNPGDLVERARWEEYQEAYREAIEKTSTPEAPWYVVPADNKWYRNWVVAQTIAETLERMDPQYPDPPDIDPNLKIE